MLMFNLKPERRPPEAAANLFPPAMRSLDRPGIGRIAMMTVPETGLGLTINDRLQPPMTHGVKEKRRHSPHPAPVTPAKGSFAPSRGRKG